jgi:sugar lactone lactonase YvrE
MRKAVTCSLAIIAILSLMLLPEVSHRAVVHADDPPQLSKLGPDVITTGSPTFTVRIEGRGFVEGAVILFDGQPLTTRVISKRVVVADVDASVVAVPGTHSVAVQNPDGQQSATATLTVVEPTADFFIRLPQNAVQQGVTDILAPFVTGEGLNKVQKIFVGGKSATFETQTDRRIQLQIPTKFNDVPARIPITAVDKQGHYSNTEIFFIVARAPKINTTDPVRLNVGTEDVLLKVFGNFNDNAQVVINGVALPTSIKKGHLEATIPASLLAQPGELIVRVEQEGVQSDDQIVPVSPSDDPFIFTVAPLRVRVGEDRATIDVVGDNFGDGTTALIDGQEAKIKGLSKRRLTIVITGDLLSAPGTHTVQVKKGDLVTSTFTFEVVPDVTVTTFAGLSREGFNDACATTATAMFRRPRRISLGPDGLLYITDQQNHAIRTLNPATGEVCTVAGTGAEGYKDSADTSDAPVFSYPNGVVVAGDGTIYVSENGNNVIRRIRRAGGAVTVDTFAGSFRLIDSTEKQQTFNSTKVGVDGFRDGPLLDGSAFRLPDDMVIAADGSIYVADAANHAIRRIRNGAVETLVGNGVPGFADGLGPNVRFNTPTGLALSLDGQFLYVADTNNHRVRRIDLATNRVSTLAGSGISGMVDGPPGESAFNQPIGLAVDSDGTLYVSEVSNNDVRRVDLLGNVTTLAGTGSNKFRDGAGAIARFSQPRGLAIDRQRGLLYVVDTENQRIRQIALR